VTEQANPAARAARIALAALGRGKEDQRGGDEFERALWAETDASLRRDPSRWPWTSTKGKQSSASWQQ
jgi:hypothetical protein